MARSVMQNKAKLSAFFVAIPMSRKQWSATGWSITTPDRGSTRSARTSQWVKKEYDSMNTNPSALTICIPAKNESRLLPGLLRSLTQQDCPLMRHTKVFLADAGSTDGTPEIANSFRDRMDIEVIPGGLPSFG